MVIADFAYMQILGKPLIFWGGVTSLTLLLITVSLPMLGKKGIVKNHLKWHKGFAIATVVAALGHGLLAILAFS